MASGNHLFEGNSIHHNTWGVFMETAWGLGSTFRNNLIYENHHATPAASAAAPVISYLRLERKIPENPSAFGGSPALVLPEAEAIPIPGTALRFGYNELELPLSGLSYDSNAFCFVEMAVRATLAAIPCGQ